MLTVSTQAAEIVLENFDSYATTADLQKRWNAFGSAASAGPATLSKAPSQTGGKAALFQLNWDAGNNANMRLAALPENLQDLSGYQSVAVTLRLADDSGGYGQPSAPTKLRLVVRGGADETIWQTDADAMPPVPGGETVTLILPLSQKTMTRESGRSSLSETLSKVGDLRLRFENEEAANTRQDAYVESITLIQ
ncbi:hypothetical protein H5P28_01405 [Ruficoccus amylovorans]|uniref:Uncharacterized protein n=1 Tax=Ruficoccus amylovorans TaxID=1804625 RepID=A0A842HB09_9BACT|nr:hypothetical protein [Ruficoccus amylovorans]MBC2592906.1 hypothetical protein [Ruficoccus amylovorans]